MSSVCSLPRASAFSVSGGHKVVRGIFARLVFLGAVVVFLSAASISQARAYIDPGTGSYILQIAAASILAGLFVLKAFWRNVKDGISRIFARRPK